MAEALLVRHRRLGGHVHARVFHAKSADHDAVSLGSLVMLTDEWDLLSAVLTAGAQRFPEDVVLTLEDEDA